MLSSRWIDSFFPAEYCFLRLFGGIWVKLHFPLKSSFTNFLYIMIKIICWSINVMNYRKQRCVISKQFAFTFNIIWWILIYIKNNKGPKMDLHGTPSWMSAQDYHWPFKTTLCFLSLRKSSKILIISLEIPFWRILKISPSSHEIRGPYQKHLRFHD